MPALEFTGQTAFVTGGGSGIGATIARLLGARGARVMVTDLDEDTANGVAREISAAGGRALAFAVDVTDANSVSRAVDATVAKFGALDLAVNNAGLATPASDLDGIEHGEWNRQIAVNLTGVFFSMQEELKQMLKQRQGGAIVNTASIAGLVGMHQRGAYAAAKHGVVGLTKSAALDYAERGIRINAIAPGYTETPLLAGRPAKQRDEIAARHPMKRMAQPAEIAESALFLLNKQARFITGTVLSVDGGYVSR